MLKKKEWLKRWKKRMVKSGEFNLFFINKNTPTAVRDMKDGLSPHESADDATEVMVDLKYFYEKMPECY